MGTKDDDVWKNLIDVLRPRLLKLIQVEPVLDYLDFIDVEQKELIKNKAKTESNIRAVDLLIETLIKNQYPAGWFRSFVVALSEAGCQHAASYVEGRPPSPSSEAENDYCVRLIQVLLPTLLEMKTNDVSRRCFELDILNQEDLEVISGKTPKEGARELLRRVVRCPPGWFSTFLQALRDTEHIPLYRELTGGNPGDEGNEPGEDGEPGSLVSADGAPGEAATQGQAAQRPGASEDETLDSSDISGMSMDESLDTTDLYQEQEEKSSDSLDVSLSDGSDAASSAGSPKKADIILRDYQMEVARPALEGKNIIVCLPTGSGKTRVAVYITKQHLDGRRSEGLPGKVVVLVNKVPLVEQHYSTEFWKFLKHQYKVEKVSGDSQLKISFTQIVQKNDIIICTAQILENYLERANDGDDDGIQLSDLTLIVIDECHHTQKGAVYNKIMIRYLKQKKKNASLKKLAKKTVPIPQILGLTASPGVGGAKKMAKAEEHILRICANLDASEILTKNESLGLNKKEPHKRIATAEERNEDPFGDVIKGIMNDIHGHGVLSPSCDLGTQNYEQWVVLMEQNAAKEENQQVRVCAEHLRRYNEALHLSNTIRMKDAFSFLHKFYKEEKKKKMAPEEDTPIKITETEMFLFDLFKEKKAQLQELTKHPEYENNILSQLRTTVLQEFTSRMEARGIIFTKTRHSAIALSQWVQDNPKFAEVGVKACYVIGAGDQSEVKPMTLAEQRDALKKFRNGEVNLLIATTVAEEGLDIAECNFVIRYALVTNEIAMIQARGRGRAEDSSYILVEEQGSGVAEREHVNEYRESMMSKAIEKVKKLDPAAYEKRILEYQLQAIMEDRVKKTKKNQKAMMMESPSKVMFNCKRCSKTVCSGEDIQIIESMHRVNVSAQFGELFIKRENTSLRERMLDYETNLVIACKDCGQEWGSMMLFRGIDCPCLHIKHFVVTFDGRNKTYTKWSELTVKFPAFDYAEHASLVAHSSEEDEDSM
ncbi:interferon-induced helicase C domain-containing protein 1 [Osmerus eperlanus]|uniref:interferon-induced helicase C domain-containing protein 1 n=1 Tax=Osmerus eperlanus TaxID=29151 RepID=UPI002E13F8AD